MSKYLTPDSPDAFLGLSKTTYAPLFRNPIECPKCKGYGGWHLEIDAYGSGRHFDAGCQNCNSWGWVEQGSADALCVHDYNRADNLGNCVNRYRCSKCGHAIEVDSSG
jgi:hypothetical protein